MRFFAVIILLIALFIPVAQSVQAQDATEAPPPMFIMPGQPEPTDEAAPPMFIMPSEPTSTPIPTATPMPIAVSDFVFNGFSYQYAERGIWFLPDVTINNHANRELRAYLWFIDQATGEYLKNPLASDEYSNDSETIFSRTDRFTPSQNNQRYGGNELALYIPYYEFPRGDFTYTPYIIIYDANSQPVLQQLTATMIATTDHLLPASGILIRNVDFLFDDAGVHYYVDLDVTGYEGQELSIFAFAGYNDSDILHNALPIEGYYQNSNGSLMGYEPLIPCCDSTQERVRIFVPYNAFPAATYSYFPIITVNRAGEMDAIETRFFRDKWVDVLGDERPAGYIINYRIDELHVAYPENWSNAAYGSPEWDDLLLIYSAYEIDNAGEIIPGEQRYWTVYAWANTRHTEGFDTLLVDVLDDSYFIVRFDYMEVVDLEATEDAIQGLKDAGRIAKAGSRYITQRVARIAAKSIMRYGNAVLIMNDIVNFFAEDRLMDTVERSYSPDDLYDFYLATGYLRQQGESDTPQFVDLSDDGWVTRNIPANDINYDTTVKMWVYGYHHQRVRE